MKSKPKDLTRPPFSRTRSKKKPRRRVNPRSKWERWLDRHNHKMDLMRTLFSFTTIVLQVVILLKIFNFV